MVIQTEDEIPLETPTIKQEMKCHMNEYVIVRNHVREINNSERESVPSGSKMSRKEHNKETSSDGSENDIYNIEKSDLEELKLYYMKCKLIVNRIEEKYGHLLNLEGNSVECGKEGCDSKSDDVESVKCTCELGKKIVFDDDGNETKALPSNYHVCSKPLKRKHSATSEQLIKEEDKEVTLLPDNLQYLSEILQNPSISVSYRNKVINKIRQIKQSLSFDLKCNKVYLKEQLSVNYDDVLSFKGANLSTMSGYLKY